MKKLKVVIVCSYTCLLMLAGCKTEIEQKDEDRITMKSDMQIVVEDDNDHSITFQLNESKAAKSLYDQLPITIDVENYSDDEKIFYPDEKLDCSDAPFANGPAGTLAYYEPWGDVVMYYDVCHGASGLYALGEAIAGVNQIAELSGRIHIRSIQQEKETDSASTSYPGETTKIETSEERDEMIHMNIIVNDTNFTASLYDNDTVRAFLAQLPMTIQMDDLHRNEKYYYFSNPLPTSPQAVSQIHSGDIKVFGRDCLVLFYKDFTTSYSYTSLGQVDNPQGLANALGSGSVSIRFEIAE